MSRTTIGIPNVLAAILVATHCQGVLAVDWEGDTSTAWADGANWGGVAPANDTTTDIANFNLAAYGGNPVFSPNAGTRSIAGITIGASNGAMTLSGTQLTIGSSGISIDSAAGKLTLSSPTTLAANQEWKTDAALNTSMDVTSTVTLNGSTLTFNTNSALGTTSQRRITITGAINDGSSAGSLIKTGAGRLYLSGNKAFTGGLDIQAGEATLNGTLSSAVDITASGAALAIDNSGSNSSIRGLDGVSGSSVFNRNGAGRTLTINTAAATNFDFAGSISSATGGAFSITKSGDGTQTFSGANTYNGATTINGGVLLVNGSLNAQASAVTVNTTATLGGTGTINRPTTVNGILSPGDGGPGTLAIGSDLTFAANSSMVFDLNVPGASDLVKVTGDLAIDDTFTIVLQGLVDAVIDPSDVFNLFDFDGTFAGDPTMFAIDATLLTAGGNINSLDTTNAAISQNGQFLVLSGLQASAAGNNVPEPAGLTIWLLFGLTFGAVGYYRARGARIESDPSAV